MKRARGWTRASWASDQRQLVGVRRFGRHGEHVVQRRDGVLERGPGVATAEIGAEEERREGVTRAPDAHGPPRVADEPCLVARRRASTASSPGASVSRRPVATTRPGPRVRSRARAAAARRSSVDGRDAREELQLERVRRDDVRQRDERSRKASAIPSRTYTPRPTSPMTGSQQ